MIKITSISGQVFFQPKKKTHLKVEKVQPAEKPVFHKDKPKNPYDDGLGRKFDKKI
jgi:hypothetical protein